jgi:hypothetical protein
VSVQRFRKKPVEVEAMQWKGNNFSEMWEFTGKSAHVRTDVADGLIVYTLEGPLSASRGDWIIKGVQGEFYPCKPDIFEQTYEAADSQEGKT